MEQQPTQVLQTRIVTVPDMNVTCLQHLNSPVIPNIERVQALGEPLHVVWADLLQEVNVVL